MSCWYESFNETLPRPRLYTQPTNCLFLVTRVCWQDYTADSYRQITSVDLSQFGSKIAMNQHWVVTPSECRYNVAWARCVVPGVGTRPRPTARLLDSVNSESVVSTGKPIIGSTPLLDPVGCWSSLSRDVVYTHMWSELQTSRLIQLKVITFRRVVCADYVAACAK